MNTELKITDKVVGSGETLEKGQTAKFHYTGMFEDGKVFDSSEGREPLEVPVGKGFVIKGWDEGLVGMQEGGERELWIPYSLAYGEAGYAGVIPPKSNLIFNVKLVSISK